MKPITNEKFESISKFLEDKKIDVLMITDYEDSRNVNLHYLSGHPTDATILVKSSGESFLVPWDVPLAEKHSEDIKVSLKVNGFEYSHAFETFAVTEFVIS